MVCKKGNISAAADELFISRSVISRALIELEKEFGVPIFLRSKSGIELNDNGRILARMFDQVSSSYQLTRERLHKMDEAEKNAVLRLGVTPTNALRVYQQYFDAFRQSCPDIRLQVREYSANDAWKLLQEGTVDAFFTPARPDSRSIFGSLDLYQTQIALCCRKDDPLTNKTSLNISDILELPLAYLNAPMPVEQVLNSCFASFGKTPNLVLLTFDQFLLRELTLRGIVYPILPDDMIDFWPEVVGIPLGFFPFSTHHLAWNNALPHSHSFERFMAFMQQKVKADQH